jgi:hypothetical protein
VNYDTVPVVFSLFVFVVFTLLPGGRNGVFFGAVVMFFLKLFA